jgi:diguanylate cyclase (GGDEF)-like protein
MVRRILRLGWLSVLLWAAWLPGAVAQRLVLDESQPRLDLWSHVTVWVDASRTATVQDALLHLSEFRPPAGPRSNLGVQRDVVWLRVPLAVPQAASGRWLLDIDYPALDRVDLHVLSDLRPVSHLRLGDQLPLADRPLPTRSHAAQLLLERGMEHELLLRVETSSTMVLPLALWREEVYRAHESRVEAGQGLLGGIALCLLLYSLAQWLVLRDNAYLYYALNVFGLALFFVNQFGLGAEHLWPGSPWAMEKVSPASVLLGLIGGILFIDRVLEVRQLYPRASRFLRACALLSALTIGLFLTGVIDYPQAHVMSTLLGPVPMLLGVPVAWVRARRGDRSALFIFLGWGLYSIGVGVMAAFLRGKVDVNFWTQHSLQFATLAEMAMWMLVLGLRNVSIRQAAEQARRERDRMSSLASTDPLTGLLNRRGLQAALARRLDQVSSQRLTAVYVMDLDGFKPVNDLLGHDAGDELLIAAAARLRGALRETDLVARVGGDEFVVVADGLPDRATAQRVGQKLLACFAEPFEIDAAPCRVGATIGYALSPHDGRDAADLIKRADQAMYAGKQAGKQQLRHLEEPALQPA